MLSAAWLLPGLVGDARMVSLSILILGTATCVSAVMHRTKGPHPSPIHPITQILSGMVISLYLPFSGPVLAALAGGSAITVLIMSTALSSMGLLALDLAFDLFNKYE